MPGVIAIKSLFIMKMNNAKVDAILDFLYIKNAKIK